MSISKELWKEIEDALKGSFASVKFKLGEKEISVERVRISENKTALAVYIDGLIEYKYMDPKKEPSDIHAQVWMERKRAVYSPSKRQEIIKAFGKRRAKEVFPNLEKVMVLLDPTFNTAASVVRKFKRLEGLEVVRIGIKTAEELIA